MRLTANILRMTYKRGYRDVKAYAKKDSSVFLCHLTGDLFVSGRPRALPRSAAKYGTKIASPDALRFIAANVHGLPGVQGHGGAMVMLCNGCSTNQPAEWEQTILYKDAYDKITFTLYAYDNDLSMREFERRRLFLVAEQDGQLSYLELPSIEVFGHCQQQSQLAKVSHPFKNSVWIEMMIPSQSDCNLRLGSRQTTRYGVLLKMEKGQLKNLLDAFPIQQSEWPGFSSEQVQRPISQLQVAFGKDEVEITKGTARVSDQQRSWLGSYKIKQE
jgi:hypothetical protein